MVKLQPEGIKGQNMDPEWRKIQSKESKKEPKGTSRKQKGSQIATKMHPKIDVWKK